ncbi:MAG: TetR/AcrR family transcriptional regulator [Bacteroidota bacterium]
MNKQEAIMQAALELLVEKGVHNTPMSAIAKAAGTGMGTIYNYFPNKEQLINEIYLLIKEKEESVFLAVDVHKPIKTQFEHYMQVLIGFHVDNPLYFRFLEQMEASPMISQENKTQGRKTVEMVVMLLKKGQEERIIKPLEVDELLTFIGGAISSYLRGYFSKPPKKASSSQNQIQMVWDGIKT